MNTPSNIAAVTLGLRHIIQTKLPPKVEVSTLPPAQAGKFVKRSGRLARVNVTLYRVSANAAGRQLPAPRRDGTPAEPPGLPALDLHYLITVYGSASPAQEHSAERLLESVCRAIHQQPLLTPADLAAALPGAEAGWKLSALIVEAAWSPAEMQFLFSAMRADYRPTLPCLVTLSEG